MHALFQLILKCNYASLPALSLERSLERRSEDFASIKDKSVLQPRAFWPFRGADSSKCVCRGFGGAMSAEKVLCAFLLHVCTMCVCWVQCHPICGIDRMPGIVQAIYMCTVYTYISTYEYNAGCLAPSDFWSSLGWEVSRILILSSLLILNDQEVSLPGLRRKEGCAFIWRSSSLGRRRHYGRTGC